MAISSRTRNLVFASLAVLAAVGGWLGVVLAQSDRAESAAFSALVVVLIASGFRAWFAPSTNGRDWWFGCAAFGLFHLLSPSTGPRQPLLSMGVDRLADLAFGPAWDQNGNPAVGIDGRLVPPSRFGEWLSRIQIDRNGSPILGYPHFIRGVTKTFACLAFGLIGALTASHLRRAVGAEASGPDRVPRVPRLGLAAMAVVAAMAGMTFVLDSRPEIYQDGWFAKARGPRPRTSPCSRPRRSWSWSPRSRPDSRGDRLARGGRDSPWSAGVPARDRHGDVRDVAPGWLRPWHQAALNRFVAEERSLVVQIRGLILMDYHTQSFYQLGRDWIALFFFLPSAWLGSIVARWVDRLARRRAEWRPRGRRSAIARMMIGLVGVGLFLAAIRGGSATWTAVLGHPIAALMLFASLWAVLGTRSAPLVVVRVRAGRRRRLPPLGHSRHHAHVRRQPRDPLADPRRRRAAPSRRLRAGDGPFRAELPHELRREDDGNPRDVYPLPRVRPHGRVPAPGVGRRHCCTIHRSPIRGELARTAYRSSSRSRIRPARIRLPVLKGHDHAEAAVPDRRRPGRGRVRVRGAGPAGRVDVPRVGRRADRADDDLRARGDHRTGRPEGPTRRRVRAGVVRRRGPAHRRGVVRRPAPLARGGPPPASPGVQRDPGDEPPRHRTERRVPHPARPVDHGVADHPDGHLPGREPGCGIVWRDALRGDRPILPPAVMAEGDEPLGDRPRRGRDGGVLRVADLVGVRSRLPRRDRPDAGLRDRRASRPRRRPGEVVRLRPDRGDDLRPGLVPVDPAGILPGVAGRPGRDGRGEARPVGRTEDHLRQRPPRRHGLRPVAGPEVGAHPARDALRLDPRRPGGGSPRGRGRDSGTKAAGPPGPGRRCSWSSSRPRRS